VIVGISEFILNKHLKLRYFQNAQKEVIFNPIVIPDNIGKSTHDETIIGYVGSLSASKGVELLLQNFVKSNFKDTKLNLYGKGATQAYENKLKEMYASNRIAFKGFQKPEDIYKNIDILVVPSLWDEPFGRIVPEANSYGIPVIVSNRGGLPELVINGKNGYIFDPDIEGDFEEKLQCTLEMFKQNAFEFDLSHFGFDAIIQRYIEVYA
jgi:glycosyltransferase involved in cell wall biosynthesis